MQFLQTIDDFQIIFVSLSKAHPGVQNNFIISNSSFSWWAQYLGNDPQKLVIAPSKWYGIEVPCHIYEDNWILVDV